MSQEGEEGSHDDVGLVNPERELELYFVGSFGWYYGVYREGPPIVARHKIEFIAKNYAELPEYLKKEPNKYTSDRVGRKKKLADGTPICVGDIYRILAIAWANLGQRDRIPSLAPTSSTGNTNRACRFGFQMRIKVEWLRKDGPATWETRGHVKQLLFKHASQSVIASNEVRYDDTVVLRKGERVHAADYFILDTAVRLEKRYWNYKQTTKQLGSPTNCQTPSKDPLWLPVEIWNLIAEWLPPLDRLSLMLTSREPPLTSLQISNTKLWAQILRRNHWIGKAAGKGIDLLLLGPGIDEVGNKASDKPYLYLFTFPVLFQRQPWFGVRGLYSAIKGERLPFNVENGLEYEFPDFILNLGGIFSLGRHIKLPSHQLETWMKADIFTLYYSALGVAKANVEIADAPHRYGTDFLIPLKDEELAVFRCNKLRNGTS